MLDVLIQSATINQDVIKKHDDGLEKEGLEYGIHCSLKRGWSIGESEWHDKEFEVTVMCAERSLVNICHVHPNLVVSRP